MLGNIILCRMLVCLHLLCHVPSCCIGWCLQAYANSKHVKIVGDMPIYVGGQSADVWAHQELFELSPSGAPANVSGVPPDAFSETGQLWGSPLYDWKVWHFGTVALFVDHDSKVCLHREGEMLSC